MSLFRSWYRALERHLFNTLFRKLLGCALPPVLLLAWLGWQAHGAAAPLRAAAPDTAARLASLAFWLPLAALALAVGGLAAFHHSVTRPLEQLRRALASGDFSRELALESEDEIRHLGDAYNGFTRDLRTVLEAAKRLGLSIAIGATRTTRLTTDSARDAERQGDLSREITGTSESVASSTGQVALVTQAITAATQANLDDVRATRQELVEAEAGMALTRQRLEDFSTLVDQLSDRSERIKDVVRLIEDVAGQTRMLAFNASIEAAHAGEAGKGFAVVADEVRKLSDRAGDAVEEITATLGGMLQDIGRTAEGLELIRTDVAGTSDLLDRTSLHFGRLLTDFESHASQLTDTTGRVQTVAATSQTIHSQAQVILDVSRQAADRLGSSLQFCLDMNRATEQLLEQVSRFRTGQSELEQVIDRVARWRDTLQDRIGALAAAGVDVFDRDYRAIPHTQPQKHLTAYAERFARELQPLFDEARRDLGAIYAVALDVNGYLAIHHSGVSEPLTGDPQVDLVKSRHQRIYFTVDTEKRRAQNTETFLFQTYMRDTGELLNDLSMPIHIQGRHWGALVTGFTPDRFLGA